MEPVGEASPGEPKKAAETEPDTLSALADIEARRQRDAEAALEGKQPEVRRGPGRPPKSAYS
jgi:hypothetical protein